MELAEYFPVWDQLEPAQRERLSQAAVKDNLTTEDIIGIALDIARHSDLGDVEPETDILASIAYEIARAASTRFVPADGEGEAAQ